MKIKHFLAILTFIVSVVASVYISLWWGIIEPILTISKAMSTDTVSFYLVIKESLKFLCREILALGIFLGGFSLAGFILSDA